MAIKIPVYEPFLKGNEKKYVNECLDSTWISSAGHFIADFEQAICKFTDIDHSVGVFNGTVALSLALAALEIGAGDEVLVPTFTYIASVNTIITAGAVPIFVESLASDWLMDPADIVRKITPKTKAIMPVHLYGFPCDMEEISKIAKAHGLKIVEDGAESLGVRVNGQHVGHLSDVITFSFFGNKTITCGEGGMVLTGDKALADKMRSMRNHGMSPDPKKRYWHDHVGYNFRMTNIQAAIGLAQTEQIDTILDEKKRVYNCYRRALLDVPLEWQENKTANDFESSYWLVSMLAQTPSKRDAIRQALDDVGVDTRPVFFCAHSMPLYAENQALMNAQVTGINEFPVADDVSARGFSVPSYPGLSDEKIKFICKIIVENA